MNCIPFFLLTFCFQAHSKVNAPPRKNTKHRLLEQKGKGQIWVKCFVFTPIFVLGLGVDILESVFRALGKCTLRSIVPLMSHYSV